MHVQHNPRRKWCEGGKNKWGKYAYVRLITYYSFRTMRGFVSNKTGRRSKKYKYVYIIFCAFTVGAGEEEWKILKNKLINSLKKLLFYRCKVDVGGTKGMVWFASFCSRFSLHLMCFYFTSVEMWFLNFFIYFSGNAIVCPVAQTKI